MKTLQKWAASCDPGRQY
jgi:hypothetical protein